MNGDNFTNSSAFGNVNRDDDLHFREKLKEICDVMTMCCLVLIMLAMGTDITFFQILKHLRRPIGILAGMICQFFVMPLVGFTHIFVFGLKGTEAVGVLLMSCCPGGAVSNVFAYYVNGDVPLSVTMTSLSTLLALGFMPMNLWIYGRWIELNNLVVPYKTLATSLALVVCPASFGIVIRWKFPKTAVYITKGGSLIGFILIPTVITLQNIAYPAVLRNTRATLVAASLTMPLVGLIFGYCTACVFRQNVAVRKTVAIESGVQNVAVAIGVLVLSKFPFEIHGLLMVFPMMYAVTMIAICFVICVIYQMYVKFCSRKPTVDDADKEKNSVTITELKNKIDESDHLSTPL